MVYFLDAIASLDLGCLSVSDRCYSNFQCFRPIPHVPYVLPFANLHVSFMCPLWTNMSLLLHVSPGFMCPLCPVCPLYTLCPQVPCVPFIPSVPWGSSVLVSFKYLRNKIRGKWRIKIDFHWFPQLNCTPDELKKWSIRKWKPSLWVDHFFFRRV